MQWAGCNYPTITPDPNTPPTITYNCDSDPGTLQPNFQISSDTCTGATLASQSGCSIQIAYVPQANTIIPSGGLDSFGAEHIAMLACRKLSLRIQPCEIDSGRFPVELKANGPSTLRMSPSAGLDFAPQKKGTTSAPQTVTLLNDPNLTTTQTVTFVGKIQVSGSYSESDDCPVTLDPGSSCTVTVVFKPSGVGFAKGQLTINYTPQLNGSFQQFVYLRGTGQ